MQLSGASFLRPSGSSRRPAVSSSRDAVISNEGDLSRLNTTDASPGTLRKISSGQRSSPVVASDHRTSSGRNASHAKYFDSTLRAIEGMHINND